jgi:hypothetical protein
MLPSVVATQVRNCVADYLHTTFRATDWGGVRPSQGADKLEPDALKSFYQAYFSRKPLVAFVFPCDKAQQDYRLFCGQCLTINGQRNPYCRSCGNKNLIRVHVPDNTHQETRDGQKHLVVTHDCPYCHSSTVPRPIFYVNASAKADSFEAVIRPDKRNSWCEDWTTRIFGAASLLLKEQLVEILHTALESLVEVGLLDARSCNGGRAWGIPLESLHLGAEGTVLMCDRCSHQIITSPSEQASLEGMRCLNMGCTGHYAPDPRTGLAYYRQIYRNGEVERIVAAEHTGLLTRTNRETLEKRFIESTRRCDPNLISATSTLEMGIDIGDLSTVFLSSVPPGTANFQQRIGRAGRRDGNALVSVVANGKPHDLFFYADPVRMLEGKIETAGCYLDASAILQRQLTAF